MYEAKCAICGKIFKTDRLTSKYCSMECAQIGQTVYYAVPRHELTCVVCGKDFMSKTVHNKYCSDECRRTADRLRKRKQYITFVQKKAEQKDEPEVRRSEKKHKSSLTDIAIKARMNHTSYGKMMAYQMGLVPEGIVTKYKDG